MYRGSAGKPFARQTDSSCFFLCDFNNGSMYMHMQMIGFWLVDITASVVYLIEATL
jgi:hypothetical protein